MRVDTLTNMCLIWDIVITSGSAHYGTLTSGKEPKGALLDGGGHLIELDGDLMKFLSVSFKGDQSDLYGVTPSANFFTHL